MGPAEVDLEAVGPAEVDLEAVGPEEVDLEAGPEAVGPEEVDLEAAGLEAVGPAEVDLEAVGLKEMDLKAKELAKPQVQLCMLSRESIRAWSNLWHIKTVCTKKRRSFKCPVTW